jgi:hypothetical protein
MSQRVQVVLSDPVAIQLRELAAGADTPHSTLAAQFVGNEIARAIKNGHVRPLRTAPVLADGNSGERPLWLEPYGGDAEWRQQMWGAIVALRGRYPEQLEALKEKWWTDESTVETLGALAVWRAELDETRQDPRDEIAFQPSSTTTPNCYAKRVAASPRHGSPARPRQSGPRSSQLLHLQLVLCQLRVTRSQASTECVRSADNCTFWRRRQL